MIKFLIFMFRSMTHFVSSMPHAYPDATVERESWHSPSHGFSLTHLTHMFRSMPHCSGPCLIQSYSVSQLTCFRPCLTQSYPFRLTFDMFWSVPHCFGPFLTQAYSVLLTCFGLCLTQSYPSSLTVDMFRSMSLFRAMPCLLYTSDLPTSVYV